MKASPFVVAVLLALGCKSDHTNPDPPQVESIAAPEFDTTSPPELVRLDNGRRVVRGCIRNVSGRDLQDVVTAFMIHYHGVANGPATVAAATPEILNGAEWCYETGSEPRPPIIVFLIEQIELTFSD